jgi:hypothetical protein
MTSIYLIGDNSNKLPERTMMPTSFCRQLDEQDTIVSSTEFIPSFLSETDPLVRKQARPSDILFPMMQLSAYTGGSGVISLA